MSKDIKVNLQFIQRLYIERFKEIQNFLIENNIKFFAIAGTLLGAVRHGGFIPWDNDIDIGMLREDYEKFLLIANKLNNEKFKVMSCRLDKSPIDHGLTKIGLLGSRQILDEFDRFDKCFHIDIFPYDKVPLNEKTKTRAAKKRKKYKMMLYFKSRNKSTTFVKTIGLRIVQFLLFPFSTHFIAKKLDSYAFSFTKKLMSYSRITTFMGVYSFDRESVPSDCIGTPKKMKFNNIDIYVPENPDLFLKSVYGNDYMIPSQKRFEETLYYGYVTEDVLNEIGKLQ